MIALVQGRRFQVQAWHASHMRSRAKTISFVVTKVIELSRDCCQNGLHINQDILTGMQSGDPLHIWVVVGSPIECISTSTSFPCHKDSAKVEKRPRDPRHAESFALLQGRRFQIHGWHMSYMRSRAKRFGLLLPRQWNHQGIASRMECR